jgi:hypothetical protein
VITIFNKRVEILLSQEDSDSKAYAVVFDESGLDAEARAYLEEARVRLVLYARDIIPDNDNMTTVVVN